MYNNALSIKANKVIERLSSIITQRIVEEDNESIENAQIKANQFINYFLGTIICKNIKVQISELKKEKYAFKLFSGNKIEQRNINQACI